MKTYETPNLNEVIHLNESRILSMLESMMNVQLMPSNDEKTYWMVKDTVKFGFINNNCKVFLFDNKSKDFKQVKRDLMLSPDDFLQKATKAYWAAANMI